MASERKTKIQRYKDMRYKVLEGVKGLEALCKTASFSNRANVMKSLFGKVSLRGLTG